MSVIDRLRGKRLAALFSVLGATVAGQVIVLAGHLQVVMQPDSATYLQWARQLEARELTPVLTAFGYPAILAVFGVRAVEVLQIVATCCVPFVIWSLVERTTGNAVASAAAGIVAGLDVYAVQWERVVGTDALGYVSMAIWCSLLARLVDRDQGLLAVAALGAWVSVLRPIFLPLVLLGYVIGGIWIGRRSVVLTAAALAPVLALFLANGVVDRTWAIRTVATGNVMAKVFRYGMQGESVPERFQDVRAAAVRTHWDGTLGSFYDSAPSVTEDEGERWGLSVLRHHPVSYTIHSLEEIVNVWLLRPARYTEWTESLVTDIVKLIVWGAYLVVPLVCVAGVVRRDPVHIVLGGLVAALLVVMGFAAYIDFERIRMPADSLAVAGAACTFAGRPRRTLTSLRSRRELTERAT